MPGSLGVLLTLAVIAAVVLLILSASSRAQQTRQAIQAKEKAQRQAALAERKAAFYSSPLPTSACPLNLHASEKCYWSGHATEVMPVTQTHRVGYYGGPSIRIARGVYIRAGGSTSQGVSSTAPKVIDEGELYITSERVIFMGSSKNVTFLIPKVLSFDLYDDGFCVNMANRKPITFLTGSPESSWVIDRIQGTPG